jgi:hypothetical protein
MVISKGFIIVLTMAFNNTDQPQTTLLYAGYGDDKKSGGKIINIQCLNQC